MKMLHTMLRVSDLESSLKFYLDVMGMSLFRRSDNEDYKYTLAFVGYGEDQSVLELTYNWGEHQYDLGSGYGHVAFGVEDIYTFCEKLEENGADVYRKPGPVMGGKTVIAFVRDPDGYPIELIQSN